MTSTHASGCNIGGSGSSRSTPLVCERIDSTRLIDVAPHTALDLEVTDLSKTDAAARILDHARTFD